MICLFIEPCSFSLSCLIIVLILFVGVKGQIRIYLHVTTMVLLVIFVQIVSILDLKNLGTKLLSVEKMNQVLKNKLQG
jgi:hypothetical protein